VLADIVDRQNDDRHVGRQWRTVWRGPDCWRMPSKMNSVLPSLQFNLWDDMHVSISAVGDLQPSADPVLDNLHGFACRTRWHERECRLHTCWSYFDPR